MLKFRVKLSRMSTYISNFDLSARLCHFLGAWKLGYCECDSRKYQECTISTISDRYLKDYFTDHFVNYQSVRYRSVIKMRSRSRDITKFSGLSPVTGRTLDIRWQVVQGDFSNFCLIIMYVIEKDAHISGCFKTSSKLQNMKLLVNSQYYIFRSYL